MDSIVAVTVGINYWNRLLQRPVTPKESESPLIWWGLM